MSTDVAERLSAVSEVLLESAGITDADAAMTLGVTVGLLTALTHPEWAAGIRQWFIEKGPQAT